MSWLRVLDILIETHVLVAVLIIDFIWTRVLDALLVNNLIEAPFLVVLVVKK